MKKLVAFLFFLSLLLIAAGLIAPSFINWNNHKQSLISQLQPYIQRKIDVAGDVKFRLIPNPQIMLDDVTLENAGGAKNPAFMKLKQLEARMKFGPLLQGRFEVDTINFAEPQVNLEVLQDGSANWTNVLKPRKEGDAGGLSENADSVQLNQVTMTNGTLHYLNQVTATEWQIDNVNLTVVADTLFGPYRVSGDIQYNNSDIGLDMKTGKYEGAPVPVNISLTPVENLPVIKLDGAADLSAGFDLQGEVSLDQGTIGSIFSSPFLGNIAFLNEIASGTAMLELKGSAAKLSDIKARLGKKGDISGSVSVLFAQGRKPEVTAELAGNDIAVSKTPAFVDVPEGFTVHLKLKGKNVTWQGVNLLTAGLNADTDKAEWVMKDARFTLPGKSTVKLAGVVTPKNKYAAYSMDISTEDLPKMLAAGNLAPKNILRGLGEAGLVKKLDWSSSMDIKRDEISLFDIDATADDKTTISGVMSIARGDKTPAFAAKLTVNDLDLSNTDADAVRNFTNKVLQNGGDLEISTRNFRNGDIALADAELKAMAGASGFAVDHLSGHAASGAEFALGGQVASLYPLSGFDMHYKLKADHPSAAAKLLGVSMPPPLTDAAAADISGALKEREGQYAFSVESADMTVNGTATRDAAGNLTYKNDIRIKNATWAQMGLPVDRLFAQKAPFNFAATLNGTGDNYTLANIAAGDVIGNLARAGGKYSGDLSADKVDVDGWFGASWAVTAPIDLNLKAKKLAWRGNDITDAALRLSADARKVAATGISGALWGGSFSADAAASRQDTGSWSGTLKGSVKGMEFQRLADALSLKRISLGHGDMDFDLASDGAKAGKDWFQGTSGTLAVRADMLTAEGYNAEKLPAFIGDIRDVPPPDLNGRISKMLKSGEKTVFRDVQGKFKIADGRIAIDKLQLGDAVSAVNADGFDDLATGKVSLTATVQLKRPPGVPSFTVNRSGDLKSLPDYTVNTKAIENQLAVNAAKIAPPDAAAPAAVKPATGSPPAALPTSDALLPETGTNDADIPGPQLPPGPEAREPGLPPSYTVSPDKPGAAAPANTMPIEAEPLTDPLTDPLSATSAIPATPEAPVPTPSAPAAPAIKGILDRLDDSTSQDTKQQISPPAEEEILPKE